MNEVSKCAEINCSSFDNLYFPLGDVNIKTWVLEATVRKHLLSSLVNFSVLTENANQFRVKSQLKTMTIKSVEEAN